MTFETFIGVIVAAAALGFLLLVLLCTFLERREEQKRKAAQEAKCKTRPTPKPPPPPVVEIKALLPAKQLSEDEKFADLLACEVAAYKREHNAQGLKPSLKHESFCDLILSAMFIPSTLYDLKRKTAEVRTVLFESEQTLTALRNQKRSDPTDVFEARRQALALFWALEYYKRLHEARCKMPEQDEPKTARQILETFRELSTERSSNKLSFPVLNLFTTKVDASGFFDPINAELSRKLSALAPKYEQARQELMEGKTRPKPAPIYQEEESQSEQERILATPATRRLADQLGVDILRVRGSGMHGRITDEDVEKAAWEKAAGNGSSRALAQDKPQTIAMPDPARQEAKRLTARLTHKQRVADEIISEWKERKETAQKQGAGDKELSRIDKDFRKLLDQLNNNEE